MKVFHINEINAKRSKWDCPPDTTKKYWGHIVTNKAKRSDSQYAYLFDPNGERVHTITRATYELLIPGSEHVRERPPLSDADFEDEILPVMFRLNRKQIDLVLESLVCWNQLVVGIDYKRGDNNVRLRIKEVLE